VASVVLGAAIIGAVVMSRRKKRIDNRLSTNLPLTGASARPSIELTEGGDAVYRGINIGGNTVAVIPTNSTAPGVGIGQSWEIKYSQLSFDKEIGQGAFGIVYLGKWRGSQVAIKTIKNLLTDKQLEDFKQETSVMAKLRPHRNIVTFLGVCTEPGNPLCIVTEYMSRGSLWGRLNHPTPISDELKLKWVRGIACGMLHLHSENLVHRDLASRNVLLGDDEGVPKITDFGMSRISGDGSGDSGAKQTKSDVGPLKYMPPESIMDRIYSTKSDIWAFGVTIIEIATQKEPYPGMETVQAATKVTHGYRHPIPENLNPYIVTMINECFSTNPSDRPEFDKLFGRLESFDSFKATSGQSSAPKPLTKSVNDPNKGYGSNNQPHYDRISNKDLQPTQPNQYGTNPENSPAPLLSTTVANNSNSNYQAMKQSLPPTRPSTRPGSINVEEDQTNYGSVNKASPLTKSQPAPVKPPSRPSYDQMPNSQAEEQIESYGSMPAQPVPKSDSYGAMPAPKNDSYGKMPANVPKSDSYGQMPANVPKSDSYGQMPANIPKSDSYGSMPPPKNDSYGKMPAPRPTSPVIPGNRPSSQTSPPPVNRSTSPAPNKSASPAPAKKTAVAPAKSPEPKNDNSYGSTSSIPTKNSAPNNYKAMPPSKTGSNPPK